MSHWFRSFFDLNNAIGYDGHTLPLLSIQVIELDDGIFIGGSINHTVADGTSFWHFMGGWSEIFNSKKEYQGSISRPPVFKRWVKDGSDPVINLPFSHHDEFIDRFEGPPFNERFYHFSSSAVSKLKIRANSECMTANKISSLQAVLALLWRSVTRVRRLPDDSETSCRLMVSNMRRLNPPLSEDYVGNPVSVVRGTATVGELTGNGLGWAAFRLHEAVMNYTDGSVKEYVESWIKRPFIYKPSQVADKNYIYIGSSPRFDKQGRWEDNDVSWKGGWWEYGCGDLFLFAATYDGS